MEDKIVQNILNQPKGMDFLIDFVRMTKEEEIAEDGPKLKEPFEFKEKILYHTDKGELEKVYSALKVITLDENIRSFLFNNDPMALKQVLGAVEVIEKWAKYRRWLDGAEWS